MSSALLVFPLLALLSAPALLLVLGRPRYLARKEAARSASQISIIVPARDEEVNIGKLLTSVNSQRTLPAEVIVVNDGSTDRTAEIALQAGAKVIDAKPLPEDWNGKPWACQQGAEAAIGDWLLFLDADTELAPNALAKLSTLTKTNKVYSVCPYHHIEKLYEELSAFFNVLMLAGSDAFSTGNQQQPALFGQCMLMSKEHYKTLGGHAAVKKEVLENFQMAKKLDALGIERECYLGKDAIAMRMFPHGFRELWASWQKGFSGGAANSAPRALLYSSIWISGLMISIVSVAILPSSLVSTTFCWLTGIAYCLGVIQCCYAFRMAGSFSLMNALLYPIALLFYQTLFFSSIVRKKQGKTTAWKGREVS